MTGIRYTTDEALVAFCWFSESNVVRELMNESFAKNLRYHILGHGPNVLLAFHGIGQDGLSCFKPFEENLGSHYTTYAFDLFFPSQNNRRYESGSFAVTDLVTKQLWKEILTHFLIQQHITRFDVAGFSMGGRFALATLESFSNQIDKTYLIAPEGISEHPLYTLATRFAPTRRIFRWSMQHPQLFFKATEILEKIGLINGSLYRFSLHVLNTAEKRNTVYNAWVSFRQLRFDIPDLYKITRSRSIDLYLFTGKFDRLLKADDVKKISRLLPGQKYVVLQSGHSQLVKKVSHYLRQMLLSETN